MTVKKEETNDIVQYLLPVFDRLEIQRENLKIDVTTERNGNKRGDIWISKTPQSAPTFEKDIVALIEAKHRNCTIGDIDWRDAMRQGHEKALGQGLNYYIVTNARSEHRFYNAHTDEEIILDGKILTELVPIDVLVKIQTQVAADNSYVIHRASKEIAPISEVMFRNTLGKLAEIYRSAGLQKGDDRIDPTVSFVVLKYISEQEEEERTLNPVIKLWGELRGIATDEQVGDLKVEFQQTASLIWGDESAYKNNKYIDFKNLISFPAKLKDTHFRKIYKELDSYHFHGANFDLFGAIYEGFASQTKKKEFGEFYTRRHITGVVARLLLSKESQPRDMKVCDPACGTGGFLTEAYKALITNYSLENRLDGQTSQMLKQSVFWGYDNDDKSVARTKLNMFLAGDGHTKMYQNDSLIGWNSGKGWEENQFDYILANPPMGQYDGEATIENYDFTNERRYELMFLEKIVRATKPGGQMAIVINDGSLEAPTRERFRRKLLEWCDINAIVSLTKYAFAPYTKEKTYVLYMQKKQPEQRGSIQSHPIWHYILDYDGFANSDKRFKTKYHDDLPELESLLTPAVALAKSYATDPALFNDNRDRYERIINEREASEGLDGMKYAYVPIDKVSDDNFFNLLSEYYLRVKLPLFRTPILDS